MSQELELNPPFPGRCGPSSNSGRMVIPCHDGFEELWHQTLRPAIGMSCRAFLQDRRRPTYTRAWQIAAGATLLTGEGLRSLWPFPRLFASVLKPRPAAGSGS